MTIDVNHLIFMEKKCYISPLVYVIYSSQRIRGK